jgi:hypothetical protein
VAADVRIEIENYERVLTAMKHEVLFIVRLVARDATEDALNRL